MAEVPIVATTIFNCIYSSPDWVINEPAINVQIKVNAVARSAIVRGEGSRYLYHQTPGMTCPVVKYAPTAATKPIIARRALRISASGVNPNFMSCSPVLC